MAKSSAVAGFGANGARRSREALLRKALFASTALVGVTLAGPVAAQSTIDSPRQGGTITVANNPSVVTVTDNTQGNGGVYVGNLYDGNHGYSNLPVTLNNVTIVATTSGTNSGSNALYTASNPGNSNNIILNGTNNLTTTVGGGAAIYETTGANMYNSLASSGSTLTGSYGWLGVGNAGQQQGFYVNGYSVNIVANGTHVTGLSESAGVAYIDSSYGGNGQGSGPGQINVSGFDTGISLTGLGSGVSLDVSGNGTISANNTGLLGTDQNGGPVTIKSGEAITVGSGGTGISATTNGGAISVTTVAGGTISGGAYGIIATGGAATISLASSVAGSTNSLLLGSAGNAVTLNSGATLSGTADLGSGTNTLTLTGAGTTDTLAVGTLVGATTLTKAGTGTWTLTGAAGAGDFVNTTVGGVTTPGVQVLAGRLIEQNTGASLGTGTVNISSNATLELANTNAYTAGQPATVTVGPITFTGVGTIVKSGTGLTSFGNNGNVNVNLSQGALIDVQAGVLQGSASHQGIWTNNQAGLNIASGATFNGSENAIFVDALTGAGTLTGGFAGTSTTTIGVAGGSGTFSGTIVDNSATAKLALTKQGTGTQTLTGLNSYTGATTISTGTLALSGSGTIATSSGIADSGIFDISGLTNGGTTVNALTGSGAVKLGGNKLTLATPGTVAASFSDGGIAGGTGGKVTLSGSGTYFFTGTGSAYTGATTINSGATLQGATNTISGGNIVDNGALIYNQASAGASSQPISGSGTLDVNGAGAVTLNGNITTSNTLSVSGAASSLTIGGTRSGGGGDSGYGSGVLLNGAGASVAVASTGAIQGGSYIGVRVTGAGDTVGNLGSITNAGTSGNDQVDAAIADYATSGTLTINNGSIDQRDRAARRDNNNGINQRGSSTSALTVNNYGLVTGECLQRDREFGQCAAC